ncbi:hypothetical protein [Leucobacter chromiireducens]|nr:hypothetical protein [Leucobacter chromiireducens]
MSNRFLSAGLAVGAAVTMALGLSACSGGSPFPEEALQGYFAPLGEVGPADKSSSLEFAAPGSPAAMYATEQIAHAQAQQDGGSLGVESQETVIESESVFLCADGYDAEGAEKADFCYEYSNIVLDEDDKVVSFDADGKPLEGRIAVGDGTSVSVADVGSVTYVSSYETIGGELVVVVEIASNVDPLTIRSYEATYVTDDGRPTSAKTTDGPIELKSDRVANVAVWFPNVGLGGTLELQFMDAEYNNFEVEIPTAK